MVLGAVGVLLLAGGFPPSGVPGVYRGGAMLLAGLAVVALCLWGAWRLAAAQRARLLVGLVCAALAGTGVTGLCCFGAETCRLAAMGGAMWFGAVGVGCMAAIGALFAVIFGFLAWRVMHRRLWLAALHLSVALVLLGAGADALYCREQALSLPVGGAGVALPLSKGGSITPAVTAFDVVRYEDGDSYTLLRHEQGSWVQLGSPVRRGDAIVYEGESWPLADLRSVEGMPRHFLVIPGQPLRLLLKNEAPVKEFRAACRVTIRPAEGKPDEVQDFTLRVNAPVTCHGWQLYLMSYRPMRDGSTHVELLARRAPGRFCALLGFLGIILSTICWSLGRTNTPDGRKGGKADEGALPHAER